MPMIVDMLGFFQLFMRSSSLWCGQTKWTLPTNNMSLYVTPVRINCEISFSMKDTGSITHSGPIKLILPGVSNPLGHKLKAYFVPSLPKTVWPAFSPLFTRATTFTSGCVAMASTVLPLPSSPKKPPATIKQFALFINGYRTAFALDSLNVAFGLYSSSGIGFKSLRCSYTALRSAINPLETSASACSLATPSVGNSIWGLLSAPRSLNESLPSLCCLGEGSGEDAGDGKSLKRPLVTNFMAQYQTYQPRGM
mmetsp:Transcript_32108/g.73436  ORF Transcript_32108/g.73436 Transcript_32108/m.73436 type:complete len:252 (+) Transcript_32108:1464-2219(+)